MKSFNNFITERVKRDPNKPGGQSGSGRPSAAGRADSYADYQDPSNTSRKGTGPAPRINPNPIPKVDPSKFGDSNVKPEDIFRRIQGTDVVGTATKAEIQAAIDAARGNKNADPYITKLASDILGGRSGETPEVVGTGAPVGTGQRYRDTTVPQVAKPRPTPTSTPKPADNVRLGVINRTTQQLDFSKNAELQAKRAARIDPKTGRATPEGVKNFALSQGGYARSGRGMSQAEFESRRARAERIFANPNSPEYKAIEDKINQSDYAGKRIRSAPSNAPSFADVKAEIDARNPVRQTKVGPLPASPVKKTKTPSEVIAQTQQTKRLEAPKVEQPAPQPAAQTTRTRQVPTSTRTTAQIKATSATSRPAVLRPLTKPTPTVPAASKPVPIAPAPAKPVAATPAPAPVKPVAAPAPSPKPVAVRPAPAPRPRSISVRAPRTSVITPSVLSKELAKNRVLANTQATARNAAGLKTVAKGLTAVTAYFDFDRAKKATLAQGGGDRRATAKGAVEAGARILGTGAGAILGTPLGAGGQVLGAVGGGETAVNFAGKAFDRVFGKAGQAVTRQTVKANLKDIYREKTPETIKQVVSKVKDATPEPIKKTFKQFASDTLGYVNKAYKGYRRFEKAMDFTKKEGK